MSRATRMGTALYIGLGLTSFGPAGEALYLSLDPHHMSAIAASFWLFGWSALGYGTGWRLASGREGDR